MIGQYVGHCIGIDFGDNVKESLNIINLGGNYNKLIFGRSEFDFWSKLV